MLSLRVSGHIYLFIHSLLRVDSLLRGSPLSSNWGSATVIEQSIAGVEVEPSDYLSDILA